MKIAVIQLNARDDKPASLATARRLAAAAIGADRPQMLAFPEMFARMGGSAEAKQRSAETLPRPGDSPAPAGNADSAYATLRDLAREYGIFVHGGSMLERDGDLVYNTTVAFGRQGEELARYRKIHRFDVTTPDGQSFRESALVAGGKDIVTYRAGDHTIGCSICYDLRFGELYRALAARGATVLMVPSAFTLQTGKDHWEVLLRARAIENGCYVVAPNQWGQHVEAGTGRQCWGHSMIVDPWGHIVAQVGDHDGHATAVIDPDHLERVRGRIPVARHRVLAG